MATEFFLTLLYVHVLDSNSIYMCVTTLVVNKGWMLLAMDILNQNTTLL